MLNVMKDYIGLELVINRPFGGFGLGSDPLGHPFLVCLFAVGVLPDVVIFALVAFQNRVFQLAEFRSVVEAEAHERRVHRKR